MDQRLLRVAWLSVFGVIVAAPALLWFSMTPTVVSAVIESESMWERLSVITGLLAVSGLVCTVTLPSRMRSLNRAFGIANVIGLHRSLGVIATILILLHLACVVAADPVNVALLNFPQAPARAQTATAATVGMVAIVLLTVFRKRLNMSYDLWRSMHLALAVAILVFSALHIWLLDQLIRDPAMGSLLVLLALVVMAVFGQRWVWRNFCDNSTEFLVREIRRENANVATLILEPKCRPNGTAGTWAFSPGQFAWIRLDRSATGEEHPFTIASSAHQETTEFTVRGSGDFSRKIRRLRPGSPVWVDGPHGDFTNDLNDGSGFVLVAGGVGITPMMSMVRTAAHRGDHRPYRLVVVASTPEDLLFRGELAELRRHLDLEVTEVLRHPCEGWSGPTGGIDVNLMSVVLADVEQPEDLDYFVCGSPALVDDVTQVLEDLGTAPDRVHIEQFDFV
ncbi:MAG: ferric reductase-like transmembrane domain-containing protein [Pseudonocardia sp.]|nr:ferric reductase-like transmembrane domain-containing protein [Pseudonocardia sp.]